MEKKYIKARRDLTFKRAKNFLYKLVLAMFVLLYANLLNAQSQGPNLPPSGINVNGPGTQGWVNAGNIISNNGQYADTGSLSANETSDYLQASNFGFTIPATATITGIVVEIERRSSSNTGNNSIRDVSVEMLKGGVIVGANRAAANDWPTATNQVESYGAVNDLWGTGWTPAQINAAGFGVSLSVRAENASRTAFVDFIRVTVYYLLPPTLTAFSPASACAGTSPVITINGANFTNPSSVFFNGMASPTVTFISSTQLNATVPAAATAGPITVTTPAGSASSSTDFTIDPLPSVDPITGATRVCRLDTTTLSNATAAGVWSSSNNAIATVDASGVVTGVTAGTVTISYTVTGGGCSNAATTLFTVDALPTLTAPSAICLGSATQLSPTSGGTWASNDPSVATIDNAGNITTITTGGATFTFTSSTTLCSATTGTINVLPAPSITTDPQAFQSVCSGTSVSLSVAAAGPGLTYQWHNGATALTNTGNISGATSQTLTLNPVATTDASSNYYVVVSGTCSPAATSAMAEIAVTQRVVITGQPAPTQTLCTGFAANLTVTATGAVLTYQWYDGGTMLTDGGNISGATTNTLTLSPLLMTDASTQYHCVVSGAAPCTSVTSANSTLIVNQSPVITSEPVATQTVCDDDPVSLSIVASGGSLTYQWYKGGTPLSDGGNISGTNTDTLNFVPIHTGDAAPNYYCVVTNACTSIPSAMAEVIVNLKPKIPAQTTSVCSDLPFSVSPANGVPNATVIVPPGTTYAWSAPTVTGGMTGGTAQSGQPTITDILSNPTNTVQTATYTVTPTSGAAGGCVGDPFTVSVTVSPVPSIVNTSPGVCSGELLDVSPVNGGGNIVPAGTTYSWGLPVVTGGMTGATTGSGQPSFSQTLLNPTSAIQTATYNVTALSGSCLGSTFTINVTVSPKPTALGTPANQTVCSGTPISAITMSNPNSVPGLVNYNWTRNNTANLTGIPASGTGGISGTLVNSSGIQQTTTFTINAVSEDGCISNPVAVNVSVDPIPVPTATPASQSRCSGAPITVVNFGTSNAVAGTTFSWTRDNTANLTGIAASGNGNSLSGSLVNITSTAQTTTFTLTATANGCFSSRTFTITINPEPVVLATPLTQTVCGGAPFLSIAVSNPNSIPGVSFSWNRDNTSNVIGMPASGSGATIAGTMTNLTNTDQTVTFTITASGVGCPSAPITAEVIVQPAPLLVLTPATQPGNCNTTAITNITLSNSNNVPGTVYSWTRDNTANLTGMPGSDSGSNSITGTLTNNTSTTQTSVFTITATAPNGCSVIKTTSITTYAPLVTPVIGSSQTVCLLSTPGALTQLTPVSGGSGVYTYQWQRSTDGIAGWQAVGGNTPTYTPPFVTGGPNYYYRLVVTNPCGSVTSNVVLIQVVNNAGFTFSLNNVPGGAICPGATFSPSISSVHADDAAVRYRWSADPNYITPASGGPVGNTGNAFWFIVWLRTSSGNFSFTPQNNTNATVTTQISITPDIYDYPGPPGGAFQCSITPQPINVTIRPTPVATVVSPASMDAVCSGTSPNLTIRGNVTDANMTFVWTRNNTAAITSPTNGGTSASIAPGGLFTIPFVLTNTTAVAQNVTYTITPVSNGCTGTPVQHTIVVQPQVTPGSIGSNQMICSGGDPAAFTETLAAVGINLTYQWQSSIVGAAGPWTNIAGATATTYDAPGPITQNTWFIRVVTATYNGVPCSVQNTTPVLVSINNIVPGSITGNQTICSGGAFTLSNAVLATGSGTISYQWESSTTGCTGPWTNVGGNVASISLSGITQTTYYRRVAISTASGLPCTDYSNCITVTVNLVTGGTVGTDEVLCGNNPVAFTEIAPSTGAGTLTYQWQSNTTSCASLSWNNIPGATSAVYDPPSGLLVTTYYRRVTTSTMNTITCTATSNCITVTANPVTAGAIAGNRTVCSGGDPAAFTETAPASGTGVTYQWQSSTIAASGPWTDISGATSNTYDVPAPVTQTTYYQRIALATVGPTTCSAASNFVTVFVNDVTAPVIAGDQTVCDTDPVAFTVPTPATGSGVLSYQWQSSTADCSGPWTNIAGATAAVYDPPTGQTTYYRVIVTSTLNSVLCTAISNCVTVTSFAKVWTGVIDADWNKAANWNPTGVPTSANCVIIPNVLHYAIISGSGYIGYCKTLTILSGGRLDINPSNSLVVTDNVTVDPMGNFFITNNASLVQINNTANVGTVVMQRITQPMYKFDYTYWNSPMVMGAYTLGNLSPNTQYDKYYSWNPTNGGGNGNWIQESVATIMNPTKGYIVRAPNSFSSNPAITQTYTATFIGTPNNGDIQIPIAIGTLGPGTSNDKMNLIGNPYPSAVNAAAFVNDPTNVSLIDGTIYFWTHHAPPSAAFPDPFYGDFVYNYSPAGYASWNTLGSTYTVPLGYGGPRPNGFIAAGQGFFVKGLGNGNAVFRNSMRVTGNNDIFFRPGNAYTSAPTAFESHRIWLNMADTQGSFSQMLVGYAEGATNALDRGFDGETFNINAISLYSIAEGKVLGIQGRALPFDQYDLVPLGYSSTVTRSFTIGIDHIDGLFAEQNIYLEDKLLNIIYDLKHAEYTFTTEAGIFNDRFVLRYTNSSLGVGNPDGAAALTAFIKARKLHVKADEPILSIKIFDISGKLVRTYKPGESQFETDFTFAEGIYFAKITLASGMTPTAKLSNNDQ